MATLILDDAVNSGLTASVSFDRWDGDRPQYAWHITITAAPEDQLCEVTGTDLRLGSCSQPQDAEALETLLTFLSAYCEAIQYERRTGQESDNRRLFPEALRPWANATDPDAVTMLAQELYRNE